MKYRGSKNPPHIQICHDSDVVDLEARNGLLQFDEVRRLANESFQTNERWVLTPQIILSLHECAARDIYSDAGSVRDGSVTIRGTDHLPPPHVDVPGHLDEMIQYINDNWEDATPVHLCSYLMWRCNWIHPFSDGNGRTTRAVSYLVFLARLGYEPGGTPTFVDMISDDKQPYYHALDDADAAHKEGVLDVSSMETLCTNLLAKQLLSVIQQANRS